MASMLAANNDKTDLTTCCDIGAAISPDDNTVATFISASSEAVRAAAIVVMRAAVPVLTAILSNSQELSKIND